MISKIKSFYSFYKKSKIKKVIDVIFSVLILLLYFWFFDSMVKSAIEVPEMKIEFYIVPLIFMMIYFFPYEIFFSRQEKEYQKLKERVKELEARVDDELASFRYGDYDASKSPQEDVLGVEGVKGCPDIKTP